METDEIIAEILDAPVCQQLENDHSEINISDVIEVIQTTDPTTAITMFPNSRGNLMGGTGASNGGLTNIDQTTLLHHQNYNGDGNNANNNDVQIQQQHQIQQNDIKKKKKAYVKIIEQPASKALRFRYECEGRSAGSIPGVNSTPENKTFPTIEIVGYKGPAVVVVSCVTKDQPYRPHPHNLVGKEGCKKGVCTVEIKSDTMKAVFSNLGIQCVKKKDIENALSAREGIRVDPFKTGFSHKFQPSSIDLNSVRLCFQVFLESEKRGRFTLGLAPVVSDPIYDKKAMSDLVICSLCSCSSTVAGGKEIILLCEKVAKEDISIRFYEEHDNQILWEGFGDFQHTDVHKQTAIKFRTPSYKTLDINQPRKVFIQLRRPSDGATSEPLPFDYLPLDSDPAVLKRKRQKINSDPTSRFPAEFYQQHQKREDYQIVEQKPQNHDGRQQAMNNQFLNMTQSTIKSEPRDNTPSPYMFGNSYRLPDQNSPSPQPLSPHNNMYNNLPSSPYGAVGGGNTTNNQFNQYGTVNNVTSGGTISPNINFNGLPEYNPYHQQPPQFGGLGNYNTQTWNNNGTIGATEGTTNIRHQISPMSINNLSSTSFNVDNLLVSGNNNNNVNNNNEGQQSWNLSSVLRHSINNFNYNTQTHSNSINLGNNGNTTEAPNLSSLLDMDSEQLIQLNSAELSGLSLS